MTLALITGGSGFIGTHLANLLLGKGYSVRVFDLKKPKAKGAEFVRGNVRDLGSLTKAMKGCGLVFHLAAQISVARSVEEPSLDLSVNGGGTLNALEAARKSGVEKLVYASSAAVYGVPEKLPIDEGHPAKPISPYGASKLTGEKYALLYSELYGLGALAVRLFNAYGEGQDPKSQYSGVISKFMHALSKGEAPVIFGDGKQTRDFVNVGDVARAFLLGAERKASGEAVNIGSGKETSINGLADICIRLSGKRLRPLYKEERKGDIKRSLADISRAGDLLGWKPEIGLEDGLRGPHQENCVESRGLG